jgi:hypothetical protein
VFAASLSIKISGYSQLKDVLAGNDPSFFGRIENENKWDNFMKKVLTDTSSHIYQVMRPSAKKEVTGTLEVLTEEQASLFPYPYRGNPLATCKKMKFFDIIRLSRIYLAKTQNAQKKEPVVKALNNMADKAEAKYNKGFMGTLRRVLSCVCNFFKAREA